MPTRKPKHKSTSTHGGGKAHQGISHPQDTLLGAYVDDMPVGAFSFETERERESPTPQSREAILKYYLPEHEEEFIMAARAPDLYRLVGALQEALRNSLKYGSNFNGLSIRDNDATDICNAVTPGEKPVHPKMADTLEAVQTFLREQLQDMYIKSPY